LYISPILSKTKEPHSNRQNSAFQALLQQFEKGKFYDKNHNIIYELNKENDIVKEYNFFGKLIF
jgi:hypothetical protein